MVFFLDFVLELELIEVCFFDQFFIVTMDELEKNIEKFQIVTTSKLFSAIAKFLPSGDDYQQLILFICQKLIKNMEFNNRVLLFSSLDLIKILFIKYN